MWGQYNVKCSSFLPVKYNALRKILQHTEAVVPSLNELKSSIALELKLLHLQEFIKLFPLLHYFEISNLPSVASAIQTKYIRHKSCNNHFTWNFCTIHPRHWNYFIVLHIHIAHACMCTHTHQHTHRVSYKSSPILYTNSVHFSWIFHRRTPTYDCKFSQFCNVWESETRY
jgi:hypothetical protein